MFTRYKGARVSVHFTVTYFDCKGNGSTQETSKLTRNGSTQETSKLTRVPRSWVNNSGLLVFDISMSETKCLQGGQSSFGK